MAAQRKIAITGASGFIGKYVVKMLHANNFNVFPIARDNGYDLCDADQLDNIPQFDLLIHLAAHSFVPDSFDRPSKTLQNNMVSTLNVLDLCRKFDSPMIFASSYVYGKPDKLPINEEHPVNHWNPYASSKLLSEELCKSYAQIFGLNIRILRLFNIFGSGQSESFLIPTIVSGLRNGSLSLKTDKPKRDFLHVTDLAELIRLCIDSPCSGLEIYNVGSGVSYSVAEIVEIAKTISRTQNVPVKYSNEERKADVLDVYADCSKVRRDLGWVPKLTFEEGMQMSLESDQ